MSLPLEQQPKFVPPDCGKVEETIHMVVMFTTLLQPAVEGEAHANMLALRTCLFLNATIEFEAQLQKKSLPKSELTRKC